MEFLDADDRYRLLIDLGKALEPMPDALKTDATLVRGCSRCRLGLSHAAKTMGGCIFWRIAMPPSLPGDYRAGVENRAGRHTKTSGKADIEGALAPFDLKKPAFTPIARRASEKYDRPHPRDCARYL